MKTFQHSPLTRLFTVGLMLFSLFFGAGNLIFPAQLGQEAGSSLWLAMSGFLLTGVGLPLLGVIAVAVAGEHNIRGVAEKVHPLFGLIFSLALYLTLGPLFATPRTATVAFEIGIAPLLRGQSAAWILPVFSLGFFAVSAYLALSPGKLVDRVGCVLTPILLFAITLLALFGIAKPMGALQSPQEPFNNIPIISGFLAGYSTMDALASLVFGGIVVQSIRGQSGHASESSVVKNILIAGGIAVGLLAMVYLFIAYLGAGSVTQLGQLHNGAAVLALSAHHYFGIAGNILIALIVLLACLTTAIGLISACAAFFTSLLPRISYSFFVVIFSITGAIIANCGLEAIVHYSIPLLMVLYPPTVVLILLTLAAPLFGHAQAVFIATISAIIPFGLLDGWRALFGLSAGFNQFLNHYLPFYGLGLGWIMPAVVGLLVGLLIEKMLVRKMVYSQ
ncbi:branched-chain amino acid transport system II carrier protein [Dichelobacter nodosus]|uniref:branched-chain amino acid transport system II carrier protein n=1 Tax=Dichelobacter nodosus TaxID=870 RepID=UPI000E28F8FC|nr:branched-chain amino acid transport system II carrier protein [Dichelobacter nodosus]AXM45880.1 branched-chain amino acid transport system II carrier protein [Dichelobacter nodosus]